MLRYVFAFLLMLSLSASCEAGFTNGVFYNAPKAVVNQCNHSFQHIRKVIRKHVLKNGRKHGRGRKHSRRHHGRKHG